jgi:hypothetical protein
MPVSVFTVVMPVSVFTVNKELSSQNLKTWDGKLKKNQAPLVFKRNYNRKQKEKKQY